MIHVSNNEVIAKKIPFKIEEWEYEAGTKILTVRGNGMQMQFQFTSYWNAIRHIRGIINTYDPGSKLVFN